MSFSPQRRRFLARASFFNSVLLRSLLGLCCSCLFWAQLLPAHAQLLEQARQSIQGKLSRGLQARHYSFVVAGDNRDGDAVFRRILKQAGYYQPRFMLHTGDFVSHGTHAQYQKFMQLSARASYPVLPVLGNHDALNQGRRWYQRYYGPADYAFSYGQDRFIFLDNANYALDAQQLNWLKTQLQLPARYRFVVAHMPPQSLIWFHAFEQGAEKMMRILERYGAHYAFFGHMHIFDKRISHEVNYVITGGAGAPQYRMPLYYSQRGGAYDHFVLMQVSDAGILDRVVRLK